MSLSRIGTFCLGALIVVVGFQNCAGAPETPSLTTDRNTLQSLTAEKGALEEESARMIDLIAADLNCAVDSDCEILTVTAACAREVASSRRRGDRREILNLISQHRADWRMYADRASLHPELAWVCKQGEPDQHAACSSAGRCVLDAVE